MGTTITPGQRLSGFVVVDVVPLPELKATGILARHERTGAEVFHLLNDDPENLFAFAFATASGDSTGVAHILEHSVLCGSENHPLKDAFLVLAQGSLQTFLNAMTFPDRTVYPASSVNEKDYFNLMAVYGDAVFRPLLARWTFDQEGRRYELADDGTLSLTGVVYNEMKGNYSSMDGIASDWAFRAVLPGTPYAHDSGGDPDFIPDLEWEDLVAFHRSRYAPANCRVFLCGDLPTERQLAFLDDRFFSRLDAGTRVPPVAKVERWTAPRAVRVPYPAGPEGKTAAIVSWVCGDAADGKDALALAALAEVLLGHDGSPLSRALVESGLGEDLAPASGLEGDLREAVFAVGLRGCEAGAEAEVEKLVLSTLEALARDGIPAPEIDAALCALEFSDREIRRAGGPFSLSWMRRSLRGWIHGATPWETLLFKTNLDALKASLAADVRFFEKLIESRLLANTHRALLVVEPDRGMASRKEAELKDSLARRAASLSQEAKADLRLRSAELERAQAAPDSPEALATIPHLSRADLSLDVETVPRAFSEAGAVPVLEHDLFTNGVTYLDLAFPADVLPPEDYAWLPFLCRAVVSAGLPGLDYAEVSTLCARTFGGCHAVLQTSSSAPGAARAASVPSGTLDLVGRDWLVFRCKFLEEKTAAAVDLARRLVLEADFEDHRRLGDLLAEFRNDLDASIAPGGHSYASGRAGRRFSRSRSVDELWSGVSQVEFGHQIDGMGIAEAASRLASIRDRLFGRGGLVANLTGSAAGIGTARAALAAALGGLGAPRPRTQAADGAFADLCDGGRPGAEALSSASLQVGFAALSLPAAPFASEAQAAELVLAHGLSTGALWESIRMKGGAYGAFAHPDGLEPVFSFATYRDPDPSRSLDAFLDALRGAREDPPDGADLDKTVIGAYSKETRPRSPSDKGMADFMRFLYGIEDSARARKLAAIVRMDAAALAETAGRLLESAGEGTAVVLGGPSEAEKAASKLGVAARDLPA